VWFVVAAELVVLAGAVGRRVEEVVPSRQPWLVAAKLVVAAPRRLAPPRP